MLVKKTKRPTFFIFFSLDLSDDDFFKNSKSKIRMYSVFFRILKKS